MQNTIVGGGDGRWGKKEKFRFRGKMNKGKGKREKEKIIQKRGKLKLHLFGRTVYTLRHFHGDLPELNVTYLVHYFLDIQNINWDKTSRIGSLLFVIMTFSQLFLSAVVARCETDVQAMKKLQHILGVNLHLNDRDLTGQDVCRILKLAEDMLTAIDFSYINFSYLNGLVGLEVDFKQLEKLRLYCCSENVLRELLGFITVLVASANGLPTPQNRVLPVEGLAS